jgi:hypothetical protein
MNRVRVQLHVMKLLPHETKTELVRVSSPASGLHLASNRIALKVQVLRVRFVESEQALEVTIENTTNEELQVPLAVQVRP